jgi:hypothetical protein
MVCYSEFVVLHLNHKAVFGCRGLNRMVKHRWVPGGGCFSLPLGGVIKSSGL